MLAVDRLNHGIGSDIGTIVLINAIMVVVASTLVVDIGVGVGVVTVLDKRVGDDWSGDLVVV